MSLYRHVARIWPMEGVGDSGGLTSPPHHHQQLKTPLIWHTMFRGAQIQQRKKAGFAGSTTEPVFSSEAANVGTDRDQIRHGRDHCRPDVPTLVKHHPDATQCLTRTRNSLTDLSPSVVVRHLQPGGPIRGLREPIPGLRSPCQILEGLA